MDFVPGFSNLHMFPPPKNEQLFPGLDGDGKGSWAQLRSTEGLFQIPSAQYYFKNKKKRKKSRQQPIKSMLKVNNALAVHSAV